MDYAIDISHHQGKLPWEKIAQSSKYCICRSTYGTMRDRRVEEHMRNAREHGIGVGVYHFYRSVQPVAQQLAVFRQVVSESGYRIGDVVPALDIEADPLPKHTPVKPSWQASVKHFCDTMVREFGDCMIYITQREFVHLGSPEWILERPLWIAHYTASPRPATPGNREWTMWQHRVAPYDPNGPGGYSEKRPELDQNRVAVDLPTATAVPWMENTITAIEELEQDDTPWFDDVCVKAMAAQFDDLEILHDDAMDGLTS